MRRTVLILASAVALVAMLAGGTWHAWREGWVPTSVLPAHPRAPLPENFLAAMQAAPAADDKDDPCVELPMKRFRDSPLGRAGLGYVEVAGLASLSLSTDALRAMPEGVKALDLLVTAGVYKGTDGAFMSDAGERLTGRTWMLTPRGWAQLGAYECLHIPAAVPTRIERSERLAPDAAGRAVYSVTAATAPRALPAWVQDPAYSLFIVDSDDLEKLRKPGTVTQRLVRTDSGWAVEAQGTGVPAPTPAQALAAVARPEALASRACVALPEPTTGIQVSTQPLAITVMDIDPRAGRPDDVAGQLLWQSRLSTLSRAGVFTETRVAGTPDSPEVNATRHVLAAPYQRWYDPRHPTCLAMGEGTLEAVSVRRTRESRPDAVPGATARFLLRLAPEAWALDPQLRLPEVELLRELGGLPVEVDLQWDGTARTWIAAHEGRPSTLVRLTPPPPPRVVVEEPAPTPRAGVSPPAAAPGGAVATGDVNWRSANGMGRVSEGGKRVTYCCAGAHSATPASRAITSGKVYAEFRLVTRPGTQTADTWTAIGVVPIKMDLAQMKTVFDFDVRPDTPTLLGHRDTLANGEVIGVAIDADARLLYFRRQGKWTNADPARGGGIPLPPGLPLVAVAKVSASSQSKGHDAWVANFGHERFQHPLPPGYSSYDGMRR